MGAPWRPAETRRALPPPPRNQRCHTLPVSTCTERFTCELCWSSSPHHPHYCSRNLAATSCTAGGRAGTCSVIFAHSARARRAGRCTGLTWTRRVILPLSFFSSSSRKSSTLCALTAALSDREERKVEGAHPSCAHGRNPAVLAATPLLRTSCPASNLKAAGTLVHQEKTRL